MTARLILLLLVVSFDCLSGYERPVDFESKVWENLQPYFLPEDHPIKAQLDEIFTFRATRDVSSMIKAGFENVHIRRYTKLTACKHPRLNGYLVKVFLDTIHKKKPDYHYWAKRIEGAKAIRKYIEKHQLGHIFKVPNKWLYPLPFSIGQKRHFALIVEDMHILDDVESERRWGGQDITHFQLKSLFDLVTALGFWDCTKPENIPFSVDGRIAFVDTENRYSQNIRYHKLTPLLSSKNRVYWQKLVDDQAKSH